MRRGWILGGVLALGAGVAGAVFGQPRLTPQTPAPQVSAPPGSSQSLVERGKYLTEAGDCVACHTKAGGARFAGGRPIPTPFGTLLSANITPDETGIGGWTAGQFYRALHEGVDDEGKHLYPAFPYNYYTKVSRADSDAIFAYLKTIPKVRSHVDRNHLTFPFNIRWLMTFWNWLFLHEGEFKPDPTKSAAWNRGAYLVEGLGHCGACHTPSNFAGAPKNGDYLQGGRFGLWFAPDLTPNQRTGLGGWTRDELIAFLKSGRNAHGSASGEMGEVVAFSTSQMTDEDLQAIATYLADQKPSPAAKEPHPDKGTMRRGEAIWVDACSACHRMQGQGVPRFFPPLSRDANLQQRDPTTVLRFILAGTRSTPTDAAPTPLSMPSFAWKLSDDEIAAVATYVRNSWGNAASPVSAHDVAKLRGKLSYPPAPSDNGRVTTLAHPGVNTWAVAGTDSRDNGTTSAGRQAPASEGQGGSRSGAANGGADKGHPGGVAAGGPG